MQQAHRTMRHTDGALDRHETVPFDKEVLKRARAEQVRATRSDPLDATLPGVAVDPSLPLILSQRRERLVLKHPNEFDQRAPAADRTLARLLIACTVVAVGSIVAAASPSLDLRAWFKKSEVAVVAPSAAAPGVVASSSATHSAAPAVAKPILPSAPSAAAAAATPQAALAAVEPRANLVAPALKAQAGSPSKVQVAHKASTSTSARANKRAKRKARTLRSAN